MATHDTATRQAPSTPRRLGPVLMGVVVAPLVATMWLAGGSNADAAFAATTTVRPGDTLSAIAQRYGTTVSALAAANGITNQNEIYAGTTLQVPGPTPVARATAGASSAAVVATGGTVTVHSGDTLTSIAARNHTTVAALIAANKITNPNLVFAGAQAHAAGSGAAPRMGTGRTAATRAAGPSGAHGVASRLSQRRQRRPGCYPACSRRCAGGNRDGSPP